MRSSLALPSTMNIRLLIGFGLVAICVPPLAYGFGILNLPIISDIAKLFTSVAQIPLFFKDKVQTFIFFTDIDGNGVVTLPDFHLAVDKLAGLHTNVDPARIKELHETVVPKAWAAFNLDQGNPGEPVGLLSILNVIVKLFQAPDVMTSIRTYSDSLFTITDMNADNVLDEEEYRLLFAVRDLSAADATNSFRSIDGNGDGKVTREESFTCAIYFATSVRQSDDKCQLVLGPIRHSEL